MKIELTITDCITCPFLLLTTECLEQNTADEFYCSLQCPVTHVFGDLENVPTRIPSRCPLRH